MAEKKPPLIKVARTPSRRMTEKRDASATAIKRTRTRFNDSSTTQSASPKSQLELVEENFGFLTEKGELLAVRFFERLLEQNPEMAPLFEGVSLDGQHKKFFASLVLIIQSLKHPEVLEDYLRGLGARHFHYGVTIEHYPIVIDTLLAVIAELSGDKWTSEVSEAWSKTIAQITDMMMTSREPKVQKTSVEERPLQIETDTEIELAQFYSVIQSISTPVMMINRDLVITYVNQASIDLMMTYEEMLTPHFPNLSIRHLVGSHIGVFQTNSVNIKTFLADLTNLPHQQAIDVGSLSFNLTATAIIDTTGNYIGNTLEWRDNNELKQQQVEREGQINRISSLINAISEGDLTQRLEGDYDDYFAVLQVAINGMIEKMATLIQQIKTASISVSVSATEFAEDNIDLSSQSEQQIASLGQALSGVTALTGRVRQSLNDVSQTNQTVTSTSEQMDRGKSVLKNATQTLAEIKESNKKFAKLADNIDDLAFHANLLGLNAAVEAARAGEKGGGFAVLASEMRSLAHRSATAVIEFKTVVSDNSKNMSEMAMWVDESDQVLEGIVSSYKEVMENGSKMALLELDRSDEIEQINEAIRYLEGMKQQNASLGVKARLASELLAEKGTSLKQILSFFDMN